MYLTDGHIIFWEIEDLHAQILILVHSEQCLEIINFVYSNLVIPMFNSKLTCPDIDSGASEHFRTHWVICTLESYDIYI